MNTLNVWVQKLHNPDLGILFIRLALGAVFINAGWMKIQNAQFVIDSFAGIGIPYWLSYVVMYVELLGGIAMILGIFTSYAGILLAIVMLVAMFKIHWVNGFSMANGGYEYVLTLLATSLAILTQGSGKYTIFKFLRK